MPWTIIKQLVDRWSLIKTHIHEPWGITKRALKPQLRPPMAKNHKAVYIHFKQLQTKYIDTPKSIHSFYDFLCYSPKVSLYWLWHWRRCGRHHTGVHLEEAVWPYFVETQTRTQLHLDALTRTDDFGIITYLLNSLRKIVLFSFVYNINYIYYICNCSYNK